MDRFPASPISTFREVFLRTCEACTSCPTGEGSGFLCGTSVRTARPATDIGDQERVIPCLSRPRELFDSEWRLGFKGGGHLY